MQGAHKILDAFVQHTAIINIPLSPKTTLPTFLSPFGAKTFGIVFGTVSIPVSSMLKIDGA